MLVCRKCQSRHPLGTRTCDCGADLRRDGITIAGRAPSREAAAPPDTAALPDLGEHPRVSRSEQRGAPPAPRRPAASGSVPPVPDLVGLDTPPRSALRTTPPTPAQPRRKHGAARAEPSRRGVEPGELAQRRKDRPPSTASPVAQPGARSDEASSVPTPDGSSARGRGATPEALRITDDVDRPNVHGDAPPAPPGDDEPAGPRPAKVGETACNRCLEPNADSRRFCQSCGETLPAFANRLAGSDNGDSSDDQSRPPRNTIWRRLTGTTVGEDHDNRTWRQRARDSGHDRVRYGTGLSPRVRLALLGAGAVIVAATIVVLGPMRERVEALLTTEPAGLRPVSAALEPGDAPGEAAAGVTPVHGFPAEHVIDEDAATGVGLALDERGQPRPAVLRLELGAATPVEEVVLLTGQPVGDEEVQLVRRPRTATICADDGTCVPLELADTSAEQRVPLDAPLPPTQMVTVRVLSVHEPFAQFMPFSVIREVRVIG